LEAQVALFEFRVVLLVALLDEEGLAVDLFL
jgi:hypothetical protein